MGTQKRLILLAGIILVLLLAGCKAKKPEYFEAEYEDTNSEIPAEPIAEDPPAPTSANPLKDYKYKWDKTDTLPDLVIIIDDFGNSAGALLEDFAALPKEVVFAILPDLSHTQSALKAAQKGGHEAIIHVPMEAEGSNVSPGKKYIKAGMQYSEINEIMQDFFRQIPTAIAVNNHMGSKATADFATMHSVSQILKAQGLFFIDSATTSKSAAFSAADEHDLFYAKRDIFLDVPDISDATLIDKINSLAKYKGRQEPIVIITHCHNRAKLEGLQKFIAQVQDMGLKLSSLKNAYPKARA